MKLNFHKDEGFSWHIMRANHIQKSHSYNSPSKVPGVQFLALSQVL